VVLKSSRRRTGGLGYSGSFYNTRTLNMSFLISIFCPGLSNFFCGSRYVKADDIATRLIFDCDGRLAGMQATVRVSDYAYFV